MRWRRRWNAHSYVTFYEPENISCMTKSRSWRKEHQLGIDSNGCRIKKIQNKNDFLGVWFVQICTVILAVMSTSVHETSEGEPNRISSTAAVRLRSAWVCLRVGLRLKPLNIAVVSILSLDTSAGTLPLLQVVILTLRIAGWGKQAAVCVARWRGHHCRWAATFVIHSQYIYTYTNIYTCSISASVQQH